MQWRLSNEKLRIGMFAWESLYSVKFGGLVPHVSELSESLAAKGHEVHIFTRSGGPGDYEQINGVHHHMLMPNQDGGIVDQMDRMCEYAMSDAAMIIHTCKSLVEEF